MSTTVSRAPRRNRQFWLDHIAQWKHSGLSKANYCQLHELNAGSFYNCSHPLRSNDKATGTAKTAVGVGAQAETSLTFMPVTLKPSDPGGKGRFVHVQRGASDVALPAELSAEQTHSWLSAIHQLHV